MATLKTTAIKLMFSNDLKRVLTVGKGYFYGSGKGEVITHLQQSDTENHEEK